jgi:hypothetical protein
MNMPRRKPYKRYFGGHMPFDTKAFLKTKFVPRTAEVPVPELQAFFPEGTKAVWIVRGLTGSECGRVNEAVEKNKNVAALLESFMSSETKEKIEAIKTSFGLSANITPDDIARRIEQLVLGSVNPVCTQEMAVKIGETVAYVLYGLTTKIVELTGRGQLPGKQPPSGETAKSAPALPSVTPGGASSLKSGRTSSPKAT